MKQLGVRGREYARRASHEARELKSGELWADDALDEVAPRMRRVS